MNESIILCMTQPYVKDCAITYDEFDGIFSFLSLHEKYAVCEILFKNGLNLVDRHIEEESMILDVENTDDEDNLSDDDFKILYDDSIFKSQVENNCIKSLAIHQVVKQSNEILCILIQQGNPQAVQDLCIKNKRLVEKYALAYKKKYKVQLDLEDLEQVGTVGLINAAHKFNPQQGTAFSSYAVFWIKQSISREIMDNGYTIRIPVYMMERINKVIATYNRLAGEGISLQRRIDQIAIELRLTEENVQECLVLKRNYLSYSSLDTPIREDGDTELGDILSDKTIECVEKIVISKDLRAELEHILKTLKPRERLIIELRFGWNNCQPKTLEEIGCMYNVTRERIRQIEAKALKKLRKNKKINGLRIFLEE